MDFSPLTTRTIPHHDKFSSREGRKVTRIIQHHWAGTGGGIERLSDPNADVSANYLILSDGTIVGQVPEGYRAFTSGSWEEDSTSITIECQNSGGVVNGQNDDPASWMVSEAAYNSIVALLVDVALRHAWGGVGASNYIGHRQVSSTACPGGFLWHRMANTRAIANARVTGGAVPPTPRPPVTAPAPTAWAFNPPSRDLQARIQRALKARGRYNGPDDGIWGPNTIKGIQITAANVGYTGGADGIPGPNTCYYVQLYAQKFGSYTGPLDKVLGPNGWMGFLLGLERP